MLQRYHRQSLYVSRACLPHIVSILVDFTRIVIQHRAIDYIAELLIHIYGHLVADAHEQINEICVLRFGHLFEKLHQNGGQSEAPIVRRYGQSGNVTVPIVAVSLRFTHDVAHDFAAGRFSYLKVFGPVCKILRVEGQAVGLGQRIEIAV